MEHAGGKGKRRYMAEVYVVVVGGGGGGDTGQQETQLRSSVYEVFFVCV